MKSEVCNNSRLNPDSYYAISECNIGHGWSCDCIKGGGRCEDFEEAEVPTIEELARDDYHCETIPNPPRGR